MAKKQLNELEKMIKTLNKSEKEYLVKNILAMLKTPALDQKEKTDSLGSKSTSCYELVEGNSNARPDCPHCHAESRLGFVIKRGMNNGAQRYKCKKCGRYFLSTTNTAFAHTHKSADVWKLFIELTITGASIQKCAEECNIAISTAFIWRHKVMNVFAVVQESVDMTGVIEMDDMAIPTNYKGNHVQGSFYEKRRLTANCINDMPRESFKRGTDNKSSKHESKVCVNCLIENGNKKFYAFGAGVGAISDEKLDFTLKKHVNKKDSIVLLDKSQTAMKYLEYNGYNFKSLASNTSDNKNEHKPEIDGDHHLQHVNAMHRHIRRFLANYNGVSSKYLNNYLAMYVWIRHMKTQQFNLKAREKFRTLTITRASFADCYISYKELKAYPALPECVA